MDKIRVVAVDDTPLIRQAISSLIDPQPHIDLVGMGKTGDDVFILLEEHEPDVLLLDLSMPQNEDPDDETRFRALPTIDRLLETYPETRIIVLSSHRIPSLIQTAREKGIPGYLLKSDDLSVHLAAAIMTVAKGAIYFSESIGPQAVKTKNGRSQNVELSDRQIDVLNAIYSAPDASYARLASDLGIKETTLKSHLSRAFSALGVTNKTAAVLKGLELGIIHKNYEA